MPGAASPAGIVSPGGIGGMVWPDGSPRSSALSGVSATAMSPKKPTGTTVAVVPRGIWYAFSISSVTSR